MRGQIPKLDCRKESPLTWRYVWRAKATLSSSNRIPSCLMCKHTMSSKSSGSTTLSLKCLRSIWSLLFLITWSKWATATPTNVFKKQKHLKKHQPLAKPKQSERTPWTSPPGKTWRRTTKQVIISPANQANTQRQSKTNLIRMHSCHLWTLRLARSWVTHQIWNLWGIGRCPLLIPTPNTFSV